MRRIKNCVLVLAALMLVVFGSMTVFADGTVEVSTTYPGVAAKAGDSVSFNMDFDNKGAEGVNTELSVISLPDGWTGYIEGNSKEISSIYLKPGETDKGAILNVDIPDDAEDGKYEISVRALAGGAASFLKTTVTVKAQQMGGNTMVTDYTDQEGTVDTTFSFATTISNNSAEDISYNFDAVLPDKGWEISYKPSGESTQVSGITIPAKGQQVMNISITPSAEAAAGTYEIPVSAISSADTLEDQFEITVKGKYAIALTTTTGNLNVETTANKKTAVTLEVVNNGNIDLENISLKSQAPDGWTVEFSESAIDLLEAGATREVTAYITPSGDAMNGDYITLVTAGTGETSTTTQFRVTVKTDTIWGIVGVILIVLALGGLVLVFRRYGRR